VADSWKKESAPYRSERGGPDVHVLTERKKAEKEGVLVRFAIVAQQAEGVTTFRGFGPLAGEKQGK